MKKILLFTFAAASLFVPIKSNAQNNNVGIGTTTPTASAMLDVVSTSKGVLVPRLTTSQMNLISSPANGLLVYNTDSACFFFYKISAWNSLCMAGGSGGVGATGPTGPAGATGPAGVAGTNGATGPTGATGIQGITGPTGGASQTAWWIVGNSGTSAGTNFLGTTDPVDLITKTNSTERIRTTSAGATLLNCATLQAGDVFSVYGNGYTGAISALGDYAINGYVSGTGSGIYGENTSTGPGVVGASTSGTGVVGQGSGTLVVGVSGKNLNALGTGIIAIGNNLATGSLLNGGTGLAANGTDVGIYSRTTTTSNGTGIVAVGNGAGGGNSLTTGSGLAGSGDETGVYGYSSSTNTATDRAGGYFQTNGGGSFSFVGFMDNTNTARKIAGNGVVSTMVKDLSGNYVYLACPEAPENLFEDYGKGMLVNGTAHITIDPIFAKNIVVNEQHELRVFIQLEGDCKGVFVTNKTQNGFDVIELQGGNSSVKFSWHIVANRADEKLPDGTISKYSAGRFTLASGPLANKKHEALKFEVPALKRKR